MEIMTQKHPYILSTLTKEKVVLKPYLLPPRNRKKPRGKRVAFFVPDDIRRGGGMINFCPPELCPQGR